MDDGTNRKIFLISKPPKPGKKRKWEFPGGKIEEKQIHSKFEEWITEDLLLEKISWEMGSETVKNLEISNTDVPLFTRSKWEDDTPSLQLVFLAKINCSEDEFLDSVELKTDEFDEYRFFHLYDLKIGDVNVKKVVEVALTKM
ncbi:MAG: hypothetical protein OEX08_02315 [Candidatus Nomurabacteria bacterium]|nr:hypothetical protein [Candidatus Nomurabacteria bacterium]